MNIELRRSYSHARLEWLANHPTINEGMRDDATPECLDLSAFDLNTHIFLHVFCDGMEAGFFMLLNHEENYEMHMGFLPEFRGKIAKRAVTQAVEWTFRNTCVSSLMAWTWSTSRGVLLLARICGFKEFTRLRHPHTVNGFLVERVHLSISKWEWMGLRPELHAVARN